MCSSRVAAIFFITNKKQMVSLFGGERGIRTLDTDLSPYASLAGKCLRPLGQLSVLLNYVLLQGRDIT